MNKFTISEKELEDKFINHLENIGYVNRKDIKNISDIQKNIKFHLERINNIELKNKKIDECDFKKYVLEKIESNNIFENSKLLRDLILINKNPKENIRLKCIDKNNLNNNIFEFSRQIVHVNEFKNRSDVTIFINGFPIVQIELKKTNVDIFEAFNQIHRYKKQSFDRGIFKILQIFIISNDISTKYFSNNIHDAQNTLVSKKNLFEWTNYENKKFTNLIEFSNYFLNKETLFKLIVNYMIINESEKKIMIFRPYQFYAVENIINKIKNDSNLNNDLNDLDERTKLNGFIWHATGSGKTLTSFKTAQILSQNKEIFKVIFLVDRRDLNDQTIKEFKKFLGTNSDDLEETENSSILAKQLVDNTTKIIVSTIQKMDKVLKKEWLYLNKNKDLLTNNIIFIIDECHRTQFGEMHKLIRRKFVKSRFFGFTGTPIFLKNSKKDALTTKEIFGVNIHSYLMKDAIADGNVLNFFVQYIKGIKKTLNVSNDIEVEGIDKEEFFKSDKYMDKVVDFIWKNNSKLTKNSLFKSMMVVTDIESAIKYYWKFRDKYPMFRIATLFSNNNNDECINENNLDNEVIKDVRTELEAIIHDFNKIYKTHFSESSFKQYSSNIQSKLKEKNPDIEMIIVVRMLTTGFDSKWINTVYLDRKLVSYDLIQTISRANRICEGKDLANIVSIRTFKKDFEESICIYNNEKFADQIIFKDSLEDLYEKINTEIEKITNNWKSVDEIKNERSELRKKDFIISMKILNKLLSIAQNFIMYNNEKINLTPKEIDEYNAVYNLIYKESKNKEVKESVLNDIDFEMEILDINDINYDYIIELLKNVKLDIDIVDIEIKIDEILEKIQKHGKNSKAKLIEEFVMEWKRKMLSNSYDNWHDKNVAEAFQDFKFNYIEDKIYDYAIENNIEYENLKEVYLKKGKEDKDFINYIDLIEKSIKGQLKLQERINLSNKTILFLESLDIDLGLNFTNKYLNR